MIFTFIIISTLITGCWGSNVDNTKKYEGEELRIGIIGDTPKTREEQVVFQKIDFDFLKAGSFDSQYDAIFITKDNLSEASNAEYAPIYRSSKIPFYFIENEKSYVSFTVEELSYEDEQDSQDGMYITCILYNKGRGKVWGYGLYNDIRSEKNIKCVYSRVFEAILEIKNNKLP